MSSRVYSYYDTKTEIPLLEKAASSMGMTVSAFQKYATLLLIERDQSVRVSMVSIQQLLADMQNALDKLSSGKIFVTSSLFAPEVWTNLSASEKRTLSYSLKKKVDENPSKYSLLKRIPGKINQYQKK